MGSRMIEVAKCRYPVDLPLGVRDANIRKISILSNKNTHMCPNATRDRQYRLIPDMTKERRKMSLIKRSVILEIRFWPNKNVIVKKIFVDSGRFTLIIQFRNFSNTGFCIPRQRSERFINKEIQRI